MKNQSNKYWEDRANTRMASYHKNSDKAINIITNAYDKAIADINEEVRKIHDKFALEGDLTPREARQLLNSKISKDELEDLKLKINHIQDEDLKKYLMSRLNSPAYKARMTRLEALKENIYIECKKAYEVELEVSKAAYIDTINNAYYKNIFDIQKGLEVGFSFAQMPTKIIEAILNNPWSGKHFSERIWGNTGVLAEHLNKIVTSGFMSGKGTKKMAMELAEITNVSKFAAERLIRTETTYMANVAEMESYKECEIEKYMFLATLDLRTSDICREHDSRLYEVDKAVPGENLPPLHPHCRSTTVAHFEDEDSTWLDKRRARDPETGKTYVVWADTNYEKWYNKYVIDKYGKDKVTIMQKKIKNKASDKKQYEKLKEILGKEVPQTFDNFQKLKYNNVKEWELLKDYAKSRSTNMISVFNTFDDYKKYKNIIETEIVGLTTSNGIKITAQSKHFIERVFGTTKDPNTEKFRAGVEINDIKEALINGVVRLKKNDPESIKFVTDKCMVSVNPKTGVLIQTNL